jgi:hypothetical protein
MVTREDGDSQFVFLLAVRQMGKKIKFGLVDRTIVYKRVDQMEPSIVGSSEELGLSRGGFAGRSWKQKRVALVR